VRWGVIGPGGIATRFADGISQLDEGEIVAVASRSQERAQDFADRFGIASAYDDPQALVEDPAVDAVYVATPHTRHEADTLLAVEAGKHVLCEKPFALNATQAGRMADAARTKGVFCMEAMWTRFLPSYRALVDVLGEGRIGDPILVEADFGYRTPVVPDDRHFDPAQGGGALLDLGIYPLQLCSLVLGLPERVVAEGVVGETGVDELVTAVTHHPGDGIGIAKAALRVGMTCEARIAGTDGWIKLPAFMHCPLSLDVAGPGGIEHIEAPVEGEGLRFQVEEVHRCVADGLTESSVMPLAETVALAQVMDDVRAQLGVTYPGE
jgi:predicted dehydrogenase